MRKLINTALLSTTAVLMALPAGAQSRVPPGHLPPAGMCRVWIDGVPPGRQPRVTDCSTAQLQASRTANSRVIYGAQTSNGDVTRPTRRCGVDALGRTVCTTVSGTYTRERTSDGWYIWRDANGNIVRRERIATSTAVTRERTSDGWYIWRDANGNIVRRQQIGTRVRDDDDDDKWDKNKDWKGEKDKGWKGNGKGKGNKHGKHN